MYFIYVKKNECFLKLSWQVWYLQGNKFNAICKLYFLYKIHKFIRYSIQKKKKKINSIYILCYVNCTRVLMNY